jgi:hypothetical protein
MPARPELLDDHSAHDDEHQHDNDGIGHGHDDEHIAAIVAGVLSRRLCWSAGRRVHLRRAQCLDVSHERVYRLQLRWRDGRMRHDTSECWELLPELQWAALYCRPSGHGGILQRHRPDMDVRLWQHLHAGRELCPVRSWPQ